MPLFLFSSFPLFLFSSFFSKQLNNSKCFHPHPHPPYSFDQFCCASSVRTLPLLICSCISRPCTPPLFLPEDYLPCVPLTNQTNEPATRMQHRKSQQSGSSPVYQPHGRWPPICLDIYSLVGSPVWPISSPRSPHCHFEISVCESGDMPML